LALPQSGQVIITVVGTGAATGSGAEPPSPRGPKLTGGAGGRCGARPVLERIEGTGAGAIGGIGGRLAAMGGGGVDGASAVAASGDAAGSFGGPPRPIGGVGDATRGASRCPHSWQNVRWLGLSRPHVVQITLRRWDNAVRGASSWARPRAHVSDAPDAPDAPDALRGGRAPRPRSRARRSGRSPTRAGPRRR
jgi:hypothetical protein